MSAIQSLRLKENKSLIKELNRGQFTGWILPMTQNYVLLCRFHSQNSFHGNPTCFGVSKHIADTSKTHKITHFLVVLSLYLKQEASQIYPLFLSYIDYPPLSPFNTCFDGRVSPFTLSITIDIHELQTSIFYFEV